MPSPPPKSTQACIKEMTRTENITVYYMSLWDVNPGRTLEEIVEPKGLLLHAVWQERDSNHNHLPSWFPHLQSWPRTTSAPGNVPLASILKDLALEGTLVLLKMDEIYQLRLIYHSRKSLIWTSVIQNLKSSLIQTSEIMIFCFDKCKYSALYTYCFTYPLYKHALVPACSDKWLSTAYFSTNKGFSTESKELLAQGLVPSFTSTHTVCYRS